MNEVGFSLQDMGYIFNKIERGSRVFSKRDISIATGVAFSYVDLCIDRFVCNGSVKSLGNGLFTINRGQN